VASSVPIRFRGQARRDAAAFYLTQLAKGILSGELSVQSGQDEMVVVTTEFMSLDIEVRQRKRATRVDVKLRWPRGPFIRAAAKKRGLAGAVKPCVPAEE
jgi:amphi-Trp domain-containing protein